VILNEYLSTKVLIVIVSDFGPVEITTHLLLV
jgi:hypothetical protein